MPSPPRPRSSPVRRLLGDESRTDARHLLRSSLPHVVEDALAVVAGREGFLGHRCRMFGPIFDMISWWRSKLRLVQRGLT